jgi:hypothetical protein
MTDEELIEWLRLHGSPRDMAAADRIEALAAARDGFQQEAENYINLLGKALAERDAALERRLAKAVEALREIAGSVPYADNPWHIALAALDEIGGGA